MTGAFSDLETDSSFAAELVARRSPAALSNGCDDLVGGRSSLVHREPVADNLSHGIVSINR
jgi:hypothetical protein